MQQKKRGRRQFIRELVEVGLFGGTAGTLLGCATPSAGAGAPSLRLPREPAMVVPPNSQVAILGQRLLGEKVLVPASGKATPSGGLISTVKGGPNLVGLHCCEDNVHAPENNGLVTATCLSCKAETSYHLDASRAHQLAMDVRAAREGLPEARPSVAMVPSEGDPIRAVGEEVLIFCAADTRAQKVWRVKPPFEAMFITFKPWGMAVDNVIYNCNMVRALLPSLKGGPELGFWWVRDTDFVLADSGSALQRHPLCVPRDLPPPPPPQGCDPHKVAGCSDTPPPAR